MPPSLRQRTAGRASSSSSSSSTSTTTATSSSTSKKTKTPSQPSTGDSSSEAFIEVESDLLHDMQDTLEDQLHKTNETVAATWRSTKASANEKMKVVEHQMSETWDASKAAFEGAKRLLRFEELPKEWQSNPYILTGYRFLSSKRQCLWSIFKIHNETCNIWTHMLGLIGLIGLGLYIHTTFLHHGTVWDHAVFLFFFLAASKCLICSTLYHTFLCHSRLPVMRCAATLDYIGIGVLITASVMATLHYGFFCDVERWIFLAFSFGMGIVGCILPLYPFFDLPSFRYFRIFIFLGMACSGIVPLTYVAYMKGPLNTWNFIAPFCKSGLAYLTGLLFYGHRFPEKQFPGVFDRWGHSHQVWHVAVVAGIYYHYMAMVHFYNSRYSFGCQAVYGGYDHHEFPDLVQQQAMHDSWMGGVISTTASSWFAKATMASVSA
ncbi:hemolysin-III related-domain-containing protein [Linnemannia elongata]|uniref:HlyIII-domain-containing protein n=1 Tax=Linnemannia elongata AG-77 TaxID=1314771 RepID=A0A197JQM5_9FUNG|nr:hemolysin-III related-domain-containing protein [Linnemannia elongata]OAQ26766.1 HlyIII-domain-containing protein [Linnemannia elongata AG-77]